jgi:hypothetical protein
LALFLARWTNHGANRDRMATGCVARSGRGFCKEITVILSDNDSYNDNVAFRPQHFVIPTGGRNLLVAGSADTAGDNRFLAACAARNDKIKKGTAEAAVPTWFIFSL